MTSDRLAIRQTRILGPNLTYVVLPILVVAAAVTSIPLVPTPLALLAQWSPHLAQGFAMNVLISILAIALGSVGGLILGIVEMSPLALLRLPTQWYVQIFKNAPLLVMVYFTTYIFPFEIHAGHYYIPFPDWVKATLGLALPASAFVAEIFRGAVQSIPTTQWEAASSLAFGRLQTLRWVILPQCVKRALPPWMNLYSTITMGTTLASLVGVNDLLNAASDASTAVHSTNFTVTVYLFTLFCFFIYCFTISISVRLIEKRTSFT